MNTILYMYFSLFVFFNLAFFWFSVTFDRLTAPVDRGVGVVHPNIFFCVYLHVLKCSESNESKKKNLYFFGRKLWSGLEPPLPPMVPTTQKYKFFFDAAPYRKALINKRLLKGRLNNVSGNAVRCNLYLHPYLEPPENPCRLSQRRCILFQKVFKRGAMLEARQFFRKFKEN